MGSPFFGCCYPLWFLARYGRSLIESCSSPSGVMGVGSLVDELWLIRESPKNGDGLEEKAEDGCEE